MMSSDQYLRAEGRVQDLLLERDELFAALVRLTKKIQRNGGRLKRAQRRLARELGEKVDQSPREIACTSCDVGPGADCLWPKGRKPSAPTPPFHRARIRAAREREFERDSPSPALEEVDLTRDMFGPPR